MRSALFSSFPSSSLETLGCTCWAQGRHPPAREGVQPAPAPSPSWGHPAPPASAAPGRCRSRTEEVGAAYRKLAVPSLQTHRRLAEI